MEAKVNETLTEEISSENQKNNKTANVLNKTWAAVRTLIACIAVILLVADTVAVCTLVTVMIEDKKTVELKAPYYEDTQDYLDLTEMYKKAPDSAEYKAMLKAFNTKYSIPYKSSQAYIDLKKAHDENPGGEEYAKALKEFQEQFDISEEKISFGD